MYVPATQILVPFNPPPSTPTAKPQADVREKILSSAVKAAQAVGYVGAGTYVYILHSTCMLCQPLGADMCIACTYLYYIRTCMLVSTTVGAGMYVHVYM